MGPVVGRGRGEVDKGGVRSGAAAVGAGGGVDEWRMKKGRMERPHRGRAR